MNFVSPWTSRFSKIVYYYKCKRDELIFSLSNNNSMNYYTSLVKTIDQLNAQGREVKLTKLPSVINIKRKAIKF